MRGNPMFVVTMPNSERLGRSFKVQLKDRVIMEKSVYKRPRNIYVLSGIDGNLRNLCRLLIKAKVVDKYLRWTFDENHLVLTGDCFHHGEEMTECLWLIYSLEEKAKKKGGHVHFILGNNEIMNLNGNWRYLHPRYGVQKDGTSTALYDGNFQLWKWLCTKNVVEKVGGMLFVHGGISEEVLRLRLSVKEINDLMRVHYADSDRNFTDTSLSILFGNATSPFGYSGYCLNPASEELVDETLQHFGVNTIITGYTLVTRIESFFDGKVINVQTDHSSTNAQALLIKDHRFYRVPSKGETERIK